MFRIVFAIHATGNHRVHLCAKVRMKATHEMLVCDMSNGWILISTLHCTLFCFVVDIKFGYPKMGFCVSHMRNEFVLSMDCVSVVFILRTLVHILHICNALRASYAISIELHRVLILLLDRFIFLFKKYCVTIDLQKVFSIHREHCLASLANSKFNITKKFSIFGCWPLVLV